MTLRFNLIVKFNSHKAASDTMWPIDEAAANAFRRGRSFKNVKKRVIGSF